MLDVVAPDQHEAAAAIDRSGVDNGKPRLAPAGHPGAEARAEQAADQPVSPHDQDEGERKYDDERQLRAEQGVHRCSRPLRDGLDRAWPTPFLPTAPDT